MSKFGDFIKNQWNGLLGTVKELKIPVLSQVASMATGLLGSHLQKSLVNDKMSGAEREAFNLNAQEAQKARDWNLEMDNTKYQRQVTDMQKAGINPALAMNGGVTTQATSNATGNASAQQTSIMPIQDFATLAASLKSAKSDQDLKKAQENYFKEQERGERIQNDANSVTLLDQQIATLRKTWLEGDLTEEEKKEVAKKIEVLEEQKKEIVSRVDLNKDQHDINEYAKKEAAVRLQFLPQQIQAGLAEDWARVGLTKSQIDTEVAKVESWDWNSAKIVSYSTARSVGANIHYNLFKNIVSPGQFAGGEGAGQGAGLGGNFSLNDNTQGILIYDRKTKELQFIPTFGYFKESKEEDKENKKADKKAKKFKPKNVGPGTQGSEWTNTD